MSAKPGTSGLSAVAPSVRLLEIAADDRAGLEAIAELHMELLDYGPMAGLGRNFVREVCYRAHMEEGVLRVALAEVDGVPAGFIATTPYSLSFHRSGLRKHAVLAGWETVKAIARDPRRLIKLLRALRVLGSRRDELKRDDSVAEGEVVCIAVRPQFLNPRFQRTTGIRLSEALVRRSADYLRRAGIDRMRMLVDSDNKPVLMLYHLLGAHFKNYSLGGEQMVEVVFDLADGRLASPTPVPALWAFEGVHAAHGAGGGDWDAYWEEISDEQEVFRAEARDHIERVRRILKPEPSARVLDFGCGFGFAAERLAPHVGSVAVWDGSSSVRRRARARLAHLPNIEFIDLSRPEDSLPAERFDLITVHSVLQYMPEAEIARWFGIWRRLLTPSGRLVVSDLIQPGTSSLRELLDYLSFAAKAGFFIDAFMGGVREFAHYFRARSSRPLTHVTPEMLARWGAEAGLSVEMLAGNTSYRRFRQAAALRL